MRTKNEDEVSQVAVLIDQQINKSELRASAIARNAGFKGHQMLSMIRHGVSRLPFERISGLARSLELDEDRLFRDCLEEYQPATLELIDRNYMPRFNKAAEQLHEALKTAGRRTKHPSFRLSDDQIKRIKSIIAEPKGE